MWRLIRNGLSALCGYLANKLLRMAVRLNPWRSHHIELLLRDAAWEHGDEDRFLPIKVVVESFCHGLCVEAEGYGVDTMEPGYGGPILVELYEKEFRVLVWSDINQEDPTHTISLDGASESLRKPEPDSWRRTESS